jgi:hypothetical protein
VFCRIFPKVLFLWSLKKVKAFNNFEFVTCLLHGLYIEFLFFLFSGAHHIDLRASTENDPDWLVEQRATEIKLIQGWISDYHQTYNAVFDI